MNQADFSPTDATTSPAAPLDLNDLERYALTSPAVARGLCAGLPVLGILISLVVGLPVFAASMAGCFFLSTALTCRKALATFTGHVLRLLVTARLVVVIVVGSLLFCASGGAWSAVVSAVTLWLSADRLLGRRALYDLWRLVRSRR